MSFLGIHIISDSAFAALQAAGHVVVAAVTAPTQTAVAALMNTDLGKTVATDIAALKDSTLSGAEKFEKVVATTLPALVALFAGHGIEKTVDEVESIGRELVQSSYDALVSKTAVPLAHELLALIAGA